ncbi:Sigma-54 interaction domain protein/Bacterial regulatory protein, Fis family [Congregibacter litoralis KT71]|uniref:Sigma-54 interaction domain protein/Bacterial regulatory protein, Fis family n=2 Tax=Congregibacter TaxID=393661 RepID=A4A4W1_9GAMM|nr:Sigma-54 interaction domain protein/Bacterial regulatory protein, Fis family [Congregibacter litoralis KT71]
MSVDVRVIAASNRDPRIAVDDGRLRADLFYRLAHIVITVPTLRERGTDVRGLANLFLMQLNDKHDTAVSFDEDTLTLISDYPWPGNVRELRHSVERAYILSDQTVTPGSLLLDSDITAKIVSSVSRRALNLRLGTSLAQCEKIIILETLRAQQGDKASTSKLLGISLKTLYSRLKLYQDRQAERGVEGTNVGNDTVTLHARSA